MYKSINRYHEQQSSLLIYRQKISNRLKRIAYNDPGVNHQTSVIQISDKELHKHQ